MSWKPFPVSWSFCILSWSKAHCVLEHLLIVLAKEPSVLEPLLIVLEKKGSYYNCHAKVRECLNALAVVNYKNNLGAGKTIVKI